MGNKTVSVRVRFEGGDQVKAGLQEVGREGTRAIESIGAVSSQTGAKLQNAGYQVSDFFVQIAAGTDPSRALAQQLPQLLQGFGLIGVAASVLVAALPSLWSLFASGAKDSETLQKELEGVSRAVDAYGDAAEAAIEPMNKLIAKYGNMADEVRRARFETAELARAEATRSLSDLLGGTGFEVGDSQGLKAMAATQQDFREPSREMQNILNLAGETQYAVAEIARQYQLSTDQALSLALATDQVRASASLGATEQVAAAQNLKDVLIGVYGSVEAADQATGGLVTSLNVAIEAAAGVASIDMATGISGAANEAARLADNLRNASLNYGKIQNTGESGPDAARRSVLGLNAPGVITGTIASGAGGVWKPPPGSGGGGGGGGADPDIARAKALTEGVRTETEKYAVALEEVNRLKEKGLITDETYNRQLEKLGDKMGELGDLGRKAASAIRGAFDNLFDDPAEALKNLSKQLAMMALYSGLAKAFPGAFGAGGAVPLVPGFAAGGRHKGGLRIVGENGPEIEATGPSMIYPNDMLRSMGRRGGGGTVVQINNNTGQPAREERSQGPDGREIVRVIVGEELTRGGLDKPMRSRFAAQPNRMKR